MFPKACLNKKENLTSITIIATMPLWGVVVKKGTKHTNKKPLNLAMFLPLFEICSHQQWLQKRTLDLVSIEEK